MRKTRLMWPMEALANVAVDYAVAVLTQVLVLPLFGLTTTLTRNLKLGLVFTSVSLLRSYVTRRLFEAFRTRPSAAQGQTRSTVAPRKARR